MNIIYDKNGYVVSQSKNLRGIIERSRKDVPVEIKVAPLASSGRGLFFAIWSNGDRVAVMFETFNLCKEFAEHPRFSGAYLAVHRIGAYPVSEGVAA